MFFLMTENIFSPARGLACAPDGSFWLNDSGNLRALHFSAGNSPTVIERFSSVPLFYSSAVNRTDPTRVMVNAIEFKIDYSKTLSPTNGSWQLVNNWAQPLVGLGSDPDQYRKYLGWATLSNGRTYGRLNNTLYELNSATGPRDTGLGANFGR